MGDLVIPLTVLGVLLGVLALSIFLFVLRRFALTRSTGSFDCSMRQESGHSAAGWMLGVARYERDRLDWYRIFAANLKPGRTFARTRLVLLDRRSPVGAEGYTLMPTAVIVRCGYGALTVEFAMSELAANGLATWLESAPPGQHTILA